MEKNYIFELQLHDEMSDEEKKAVIKWMVETPIGIKKLIITSQTKITEVIPL